MKSSDSPKLKKVGIEIDPQLHDKINEKFQSQRLLSDGKTINPDVYTNKGKFFGAIFTELLKRGVEADKEKKKRKINFFKIGFFISLLLGIFLLIKLHLKSKALALFEK